MVDKSMRHIHAINPNRRAISDCWQMGERTKNAVIPYNVPTTSLPEKRYAYTFALRFRCSSPEILPKIDSQNLLEIAGSTAQTFKDISSAIKKREEARSASKKGRKSSAVAPETVTIPPKQSTGKKRSKEAEETPKAKEKSRSKDREPKEAEETPKSKEKRVLCDDRETSGNTNEPAVEKPKEEKATEGSVAESAEQRAVESGIAPDSEKDKENLEVKPEEKSNRKRKRSVSSSSSCSSASSSRHRSSDESDEERNSHAKTTVKKKAHSERPCVECGRWLDDCIMEWKETLGPSSVWCSRECIERRVARAHEVLPETYGALTLLRGDGQLLTTGPTLVNLAEFIYKYPEYEPVLPVAKKKSSAKNGMNVIASCSSRSLLEPSYCRVSEQVADAKKSNPKILSKDSDRIRAKMDKVKSAMKLCKDAAEGVEAALFKACESNLNSPKYKGWTKTFIENVADCRNK
ncbi:hypothetical protein ANCDUO_15292, partial [Ancylostoma duodenale]